jgi:hypothetical protein
MKQKKQPKKSQVIPAGTKQETGFTRFIKKQKRAGDISVIKDAKANNEEELPGTGVNKPEPDSSDE